MNPAGKALWYIESHFTEQIGLDEVASAAGVSRFHMSRIFPMATGYSVQQYMRGRRLTEAARRLAEGAPDILAVALDAGYGSHEAFTRAFRDQFGITPEALRAQGNLDNIKLLEPIKMDETLLATLEPPQYVDGRVYQIAGVSERYHANATANIPAQWQRFVPYLGHIPGQIGRVTYGVVCNSDDSGNADYICGVEVSDLTTVQPELTRLRIPEQRYAVFQHRAHVSEIRRTWFSIWSKWLPESGNKVFEGPAFERYGESFDPVTGAGGLEIWVPVIR